jgi:hypothetical protein
MRLSWRDGFETLLAVVVVVAMAGVLGRQDWPLLGTDRSAVLALFGVGFVMCQLGRGAIKSTADLVRGPFMTAATVLGAIALVVTVVGIIVGSRALVLVLGTVLVITWALATVHHAVDAARPSGLTGRASGTIR